MCGRYSASRPPDLVEEAYAAVAVDEAPPASWNVAPTDPVSAVVHRNGRREVRTLRWGLVPSWSKDAKAAARLINARAETVATKSAFRVPLARRRCLIPADGWYEWMAQAGRRKQPFFIHAAGHLAFAGLYDFWRDPATGDMRPTCAIVTTDASEDLRYLHDRMPVVLPPEDWETWLDPENEDVGSVTGLLVPRSGFDAYPVADLVNSVRNNGPDLLAPVPAST